MVRCPAAPPSPPQPPFPLHPQRAKRVASPHVASPRMTPSCCASLLLRCPPTWSLAAKSLDYDKKAKKAKPADALDTAFKVAEATFGVPRLLEASDLVSGQVDDKSVITYVAKLRQACIAYEEGLAERQTAERAAAEAARAAKEREATAAELGRLEGLSGELRAWCAEKAKGFLEAAASEEVS